MTRSKFAGGGRLGSKLLSCALTIALAATMCVWPAATSATQAYADDAGAKSINIGTSCITVPENGWNATDGNYLYYGSFNDAPVKYRVLASDDGEMLLDSDKILSAMPFTDSEEDTANKYPSSDLYSYLKDGKLPYVASGTPTSTSLFSDKELGAVSDTAVDAAEAYTAGVIPYVDYAANAGKAFLLSAKEASSLYETNDARVKSGEGDFWWLRSAVDPTELAGYVGVISETGSFYLGLPNAFLRTGVAPASYLSTENVLFTTAKGFDKTKALSAVSSTTSKEWKVTLEDEDLSVSVSPATEDENVITVPYTVQGDAATQVSVLIASGDIDDEDTEILYYGKLGDATATSGTFTLPTNLPTGYKIYAFAEDVNATTSVTDGWGYTDYASKPVEVTVLENYMVTFDSNGGSAVVNPTVKVVEGKTVAKPTPDPTKEGFTFKYWALNGEEFDFETPINQSITLEAVWESLTRLAGDNADETAVAISKESFESSEYAVIARMDDFADALGASGLAGTLDCPILLTGRNKLSEATAAELSRLGVSTVYIIGGTAALSTQIDKDIAALDIDSVYRVWGEESWDTSLACAEAIKELGGNERGDVIVAMSSNFQDALSMSSFAYKYQVPLILENNAYGTTGELTNDAQAFIETNATGTVWVPGGFGAVAPETVEGVFDDATIVRLYGNDGYDTSNQIATYMTQKGLLSASTVVIASGAQKAHGVDALAGAALAGVQGGVVLLANANSSLEAINLTTIDAGEDSEGYESYLTANADDVITAYMLGGTVVSPESLFAKVEKLLGLE